jgi:quercetin dioxygenase-like cupin family protein
VTIQRRRAGAWSDLALGLSQRLLAEVATASMKLYRLEGSTTVPEPSHPEGQIGFILQGGGRHLVDGAVEEVRAGDSYYIPPEIRHAFASVPGEETLLVDMLLRDSEVPTPQAP